MKPFLTVWTVLLLVVYMCAIIGILHMTGTAWRRGWRFSLIELLVLTVFVAIAAATIGRGHEPCDTVW